MSARGDTEKSGGDAIGNAIRFLLVRVDDRLLHGQVVYGWGARLEPWIYRVIDDRAARDEWEAEAFREASGGLPVAVHGVDEFGAKWRSLPDAAHTFVLMRDLATLERLWEQGFRPQGEINLGGIRGGPGSLEILPYLQLQARDREILAALIARGCPLYAQEIPDSPRHAAPVLAELLGG